MNKFRRYLELVLLSYAMPVWALVDPAWTSQTAPGWMADIQIWVSADNSYHPFCKGALIAPNWVLSSGLCVTDPDHYLDNLGSKDPKFQIKLGANDAGVEVENFYYSDDYTLALFRLALPGEAVPLKVSTRTAAQLLGSQITIFSKEKSSAVYHYFYNPLVFAPQVTCQMSGFEFIYSGALCFVRTKTTITPNLYHTTAKVIDPTAASAPATSLDKQAPVYKTGKQLYLDFRAFNSYPCLEDVGSPLLAKAADGSDEIVGVVAGVGMTAGLPICGMSLYNKFPAAEVISSFVDKTYARYDFVATCPSSPAPTVSYTGGAGITLQWSSVKGAAGYKVHYTTRHGQVPIVAVDVKTQTVISTPLAHGTDYLVAVTAYNANCSSTPSKPLAVNVDVH